MPPHRGGGERKRERVLHKKRGGGGGEKGGGAFTRGGGGGADCNGIFWRRPEGGFMRAVCVCPRASLILARRAPLFNVFVLFSKTGNKTGVCPARCTMVPKRSMVHLFLTMQS